MTDETTTPEPQITAGSIPQAFLSPAAEVHHDIKPLVESILAEQPALATARLVNMKRSMLEIPRMAIGTRKLQPVAAGLPTSTVAPEPFASVKLVSTKLTIPVKLTNEFLGDNPQKDEDELARDLMGVVAGGDLADLAFNGDVTSSDNLLWAHDGWLKRMTLLRRTSLRRRHVARRELSHMLASLEPKFRRDRSKLRFYVCPATYQDAIEAIISVPGEQADRYLAGEENLLPMVDGVPLIMAPYMIQGHALLTNPDNLVLGFESYFKVRKTREGKAAIEEDAVFFAGHIRVAFAVQDPEAGYHFHARPWHEVFGRTGAFVAAQARRAKWMTKRAVRRAKNRIAFRREDAAE